MTSCVQPLNPVNRPLSWQMLWREHSLRFHSPPVDDSALSAFHPSLVCSVPVVPGVNKSHKVNSLTVFIFLFSLAILSFHRVSVHGQFRNTCYQIHTFWCRICPFWYLCCDNQVVLVQAALCILLRWLPETERCARSTDLTGTVHVTELVEVNLILWQVVICRKMQNGLFSFTKIRDYLVY